ncbi:hypothetical protein FIU92_00575 [Ruegeria sp. THAF33]|nr:hypothetical protein FIU92_00575 [Ruegeria sp. THAF33]
MKSVNGIRARKLKSHQIANVNFVRNAVIGTERSEGLLSALASQISKRPTAAICVSRIKGLVRVQSCQWCSGREGLRCVDRSTYSQVGCNNETEVDVIDWMEGGELVARTPSAS